MKTQAIFLAALAAAPSALAHTVWSVLYVDGVSQGDGAAMRMRQDPSKASYPLENYNSDDMACNVDGTNGVKFVSPVQDGATLTFEMRSWPDNPSKESLDKGHAGPCAVYLKKVSSAIEDKGAGDGWFKLMDDGYHADTDKWCTDRLIENNGRLSVQLPKGLEGGYYLARPEVVALHNATEGGAQFYTGCAQIYLQSTGNLVPESTIAIPGPDYVKDGSPSVKFNIYVNKNADYQVPGPAVAKFTRSSSNGAQGGGASGSQAEGIVPETCIAQNANWCGKEVASYSDEAGCWAAGEDCWAQGKKCWDEAPATGGSVCELWSNKCTALNDACKAKNFSGPPNKGKVITPERATIEIGALIAPVAGGEVKEVDSKPATTSQAETAPSSTEEPSFISSVPLLSFEGGLYDSPLTTSEPSPSTSSAKVTQPSFTSSVPLLSFSGGLYDSPLTTLRTSTKPAPTGSSCREGYICVTEWNVEVVTETKYVTVSVDAPGYRAGRRRS